MSESLMEKKKINHNLIEIIYYLLIIQKKVFNLFKAEDNNKKILFILRGLLILLENHNY